MPETNKTKYGFPKGRVAKTLREILTGAFTSQDVEIITAVLVCHLMLEARFNDVLDSLLVHDLPRRAQAGKSNGQTANKKMREQVLQVIQDTFFSQKLKFIEPCLKLWFPDDAKVIREVNTIRNHIMHGKKLKELTYGGKSIWTEEGIEKLFIDVQSASFALRDFLEMIDMPRALAEKRAKRLKELGVSVR